MDGEITQILNRISAGETSERERLWEVVYDELRQMARGLRWTPMFGHLQG